jgi:plastocyanin
MARFWTLPIAVIGVLALVMSACGDDDGADVTVLDEGGSGSETASEASTGSGSEVAAADKPCAPVGEDLEADATVELTLRDYEFDPDEVEVDAGVVTFATSNAGAEAHEVAFLPGGGEVPLTDDGAPDEDALAEAGAFELEAYGPGLECNATYDLAPGTYTMFCIVEAGGITHYELGMEGTLTVS